MNVGNSSHCICGPVGDAVCNGHARVVDRAGTALGDLRLPQPSRSLIKSTPVAGHFACRLTAEIHDRKISGISMNGRKTRGCRIGTPPESTSVQQFSSESTFCRTRGVCAPRGRPASKGFMTNYNRISGDRCLGNHSGAD